MASLLWLNAFATWPNMMNCSSDGVRHLVRTLHNPQRKGSLSLAFGTPESWPYSCALSIAQGFRRAVTSTGRDDIAIVLRDGANNEMSSGLGREEVRVIKDAPGVARENENAVASSELFVIIDVPKRSSGTDANVPFRGVEALASAVRGNVKIIQGRMFEPGRNEVIAGVAAAREFAGLDVGYTSNPAGPSGMSAFSPRAEE
jgi:hypothetical protein